MKQVNIFSFLNDILYKKRGDLLDSPGAESVFVPYMIQRWLSMYDPKVAKLLNETVNVLWRAFDNKQEWYQIFISLIPKNRFKKISYIKKNKEKSKNEIDRNEYIKHIASLNDISQREIRELIDLFDINIKNKIKEIKQNG